MRLNDLLIEELRLLAQFPLDSHQEGLKVHSNAPVTLVEACARLHQKGLVTQIDGGYLTEPGRQAAEHLKVVSSILTTPNFLPQSS